MILGEESFLRRVLPCDAVCGADTLEYPEGRRAVLIVGGSAASSSGGSSAGSCVG